MITGPLSRRLLAQQPRLLSQRPIARVVNNTRPLSYTSQFLARKDAQDKDSLKPEPNEYSKSGSDDEAARIEETAFDPNKTSPEEQHASAEGESQKVSYRDFSVFRISTPSQLLRPWKMLETG